MMEGGLFLLLFTMTFDMTSTRPIGLRFFHRRPPTSKTRLEKPLLDGLFEF